MASSTWNSRRMRVRPRYRRAGICIDLGAPARSGIICCMGRHAIYPGTFDPITNGHKDLVRRAASIFDTVLVAVASNPGKTPMFTLEERVDLSRRVLADIPNVEVAGYAGLTVDFMKQHDFKVVVRGLRAVSDFEFEFQL